MFQLKMEGREEEGRKGEKERRKRGRKGAKDYKTARKQLIR